MNIWLDFPDRERIAGRETVDFFWLVRTKQNSAFWLAEMRLFRGCLRFVRYKWRNSFSEPPLSETLFSEPPLSEPPLDGILFWRLLLRFHF
jgi:hypothetical protein